jgi:hypothetical protein
MSPQGSSRSATSNKILAVWRQFKGDVVVEAQYTPTSTVDGSSFTRIRSGQGSLKVKDQSSKAKMFLSQDRATYPTTANCTFERTAVADKLGKKRIDYAVLILNTNELDGTIQKRLESESFPVDVLRNGKAIVRVASGYGYGLNTTEIETLSLEIQAGFSAAPDDRFTIKTVRLLDDDYM